MKQGSINNFFKRQLYDNGEGTSKRNKYNESSQVPQPYEPSQKPKVRQEPQPNEPTQRPRAPQGPQPNEPSQIPQVPKTFDLNDLPSDPGDRPKITSYHPNQRDEIRRTYLTKGPCQPKGHTFESKLVGKKLRRFVVEWFVEFPWLEYSIKKYKAYCLCCYLFGDMVGNKVEKMHLQPITLTLGVKNIIPETYWQGYEGASNMSGAFNGLKSLILKENNSAHYIHCFVAVAKKHDDVEEFFEQLALVVTVVCGSCKRKYMILEMQKEKVEAEISIGEIETGRGLNQEISLA
ncbi:uncharacterized protein LOC111912136 [Lactuca sativa]|uniref:uncharacterized protein LOC111912136 n=1 Tax=Lactuca sativa TaxID=4236 RepID=UPI000CD946CD|nr:uncharacterized protein LOC111912136 [Lactuca sativa]